MVPAQLRNAADAAESLNMKDVPGKWLELIAKGWSILPTSCSCGGSWAWLNPQKVMHGCVCHQTPE